MAGKRFRSRQWERWIKRAYWLWQERGTAYVLGRALRRLRGGLQYNPDWIKAYDTISRRDVEQIRQRIAQFKRAPSISVVMSAVAAPFDHLSAAIDSVTAQIYDQWDLHIAADSRVEPKVRSLIEWYAERDPRIRLVVSEASANAVVPIERALAQTTGEFVAFFSSDGLLRPHTLYMLAEELNAYPVANLIYSDEDKIDDFGRRFDPHFKTDWNPDLFLSQNYFDHFTAYRRQLVTDVGGLRASFEDSAEYDLALRIIERIPGATIRHLPFVLHHWKAADEAAIVRSESARSKAAFARKAIQQHLDRRGIAGSVETSRSGFNHSIRRLLSMAPPRVSLMIPTRDGLDLLRGSVGSILELTDYPNYEIVILDNQSREPATLLYLEHLSSDRRVRVVRYDQAFNYSAINNFGARQCSGEILGLVNNDVVVINGGWLKEMVSHAIRTEVGAVGCMLYYPEDIIQHAGIIVGAGGSATNCYGGLPRGASGYCGRAELIQNYSAVTGACMLTRASVYAEVGGLNETELSVAFNDVDYCLRLRERGYLITWTPNAELYHLESVSRGDDLSPSKIERFNRERNYLAGRWLGELQADPYHSPNFSRDTPPFTALDRPRRPGPWIKRETSRIDEL